MPSYRNPITYRSYRTKHHRLKSAASTNATSVKASAGQIYGCAAYNRTNQDKYLKLYDKASAPTVGTDVPAWTICLPARGGYDAPASPIGEPFENGIAYAITANVEDTDTTVVGVDDVHGRILYA